MSDLQASADQVSEFGFIATVKILGNLWALVSAGRDWSVACESQGRCPRWGWRSNHRRVSLSSYLTTRVRRGIDFIYSVGSFVAISSPQVGSPSGAQDWPLDFLCAGLCPALWVSPTAQVLFFILATSILILKNGLS